MVLGLQGKKDGREGEREEMWGNVEIRVVGEGSSAESPDILFLFIDNYLLQCQIQ